MLIANLQLFSETYYLFASLIATYRLICLTQKLGELENAVVVEWHRDRKMKQQQHIRKGFTRGIEPECAGLIGNIFMMKNIFSITIWQNDFHNKGFPNNVGYLGCG